MNYQEFKDRTNQAATYEMFQLFEPMYMAGNMDKNEFCAMVKGKVNAMCKAEWNKQNRIFRLRVDTCPNGNDIYEVCIKHGTDIMTGRMILQKTGYRGIGQADVQRGWGIAWKAGIAKLTEAEQEDIRTSDTFACVC